MYGAHFVDNSGAFVIGRNPELAAQPELGLWAERWHWTNSGHSFDPGVAASVLD